MKKLIKPFGVILFLLMTGVSTFAQNDFDGSSPNTDNYKGFCYPVKAGNSVTIPIKVKCNITKKYQPYTVSIDESLSFNPSGWVTINNNSQSVDSSKTITFNLTITPPKTPVLTSEGKYPFTLYFKVYNKDNTLLDPTFTLPSFTVIVDNSVPAKPTPSLSSRNSTSITITGYSSSDLGNLSSDYTLENDTSGINGIQSLTFLLKRVSDGKIIDNTKEDVEDVSSFYVFKQSTTSITPNTSYTAYVTAADLAGNASISDGLLITTPPAPPTSCTVASTYCTSTFTWTTSAGATGYNVYDASYNLITASPIAATSPTTSYTITGLSAGATVKLYIKALSSAGGLSEYSKLFSTKTLTVPTPSISGLAIVCTLGTSITYTASTPPSGCSVSWANSTNLTPSATAGSSATFITNANGSGWVTAAFVSCGGSGAKGQKPVVIGSPTTPVIIGEKTISCGGGELYTEENRQQVKWSIASPFVITGGATGSKCNVQAPSESRVAWLYATAINTCGTKRGEFQIKVICESYTVSPNPTTSETTVSQLSSTANESNVNSKAIKSIRIVDKFGKTYFFQQYDGETLDAKLNISSFPAGIYIVTINEGGEAESHKIIKQ